MKWKTLVGALLAATLLSGCNTIPKNGSVLNQKVSDGIQKSQIEIEKIVRAFGVSEQAYLDRHWGKLFKKMEDAYIKKHSVSAVKVQTHEFRRTMAENATVMMMDIRGKLKAIEEKLIADTRANSKKLIEINDEVTRYLLSTEKYDEANKRVTDKLGEITGIDISELAGKAKKLIDNIGKLGG